MQSRMINGITCPNCGASARRVLESRRLHDRVRRRCICSECSGRFTTYELRYDEIAARIDSIVSARAARLLDRFREAEQALATLRQQLEEELDVTEVTQVTELSCEQCLHWDVSRCDLGHPDPVEEGPAFAQWCSSYSAVRMPRD